MPVAVLVYLGEGPWGEQRDALGLQAATILGAVGLSKVWEN